MYLQKNQIRLVERLAKLPADLRDAVIDDLEGYADKVLTVMENHVALEQNS